MRRKKTFDQPPVERAYDTQLLAEPGGKWRLLHFVPCIAYLGMYFAFHGM
jgi:hypothetical protein